jgi:nucleotide-binding universal stress UspA family protein
MLRRILVPLDTSRFAEQALPHAIGLARRAQAKVQLICVRPSLTLGPGSGEEARYLADLAAQLTPELPDDITYHVLTDELTPYYAPLEPHRVADVLSQYAREHDADLIVMATHGRGGMRRAWLGSVADSLIRIASRPVLLIRPQDEAFGSAAGADRGICHIVIGLDGSTTAEQVIPPALQLGSAFGARYSLVRVLSPWNVDGYEPWSARVAAFGVTSPTFLEDPVPLLNRSDVAADLERVAAAIRATGAAVTTHVLEKSSADEALVHFASANGADAIALATRGVGGVERLLIGSVADSVVRTSEIPVLLCNIRRLEPTPQATNDRTTAVVAVPSAREQP